MSLLDTAGENLNMGRCSHVSETYLQKADSEIQSGVNGMVIAPSSTVGRSLSEPICEDGSRGFEGDPVPIMVGGSLAMGIDGSNLVKVGVENMK